MELRDAIPGYRQAGFVDKHEARRLELYAGMLLRASGESLSWPRSVAGIMALSLSGTKVAATGRRWVVCAAKIATRLLGP